MANITKTLSLILDPSKTALDPIEQIYALRHDRSAIEACANMASARAIANGTAPSHNTEDKEHTYPCSAYITPSGRYYVETRLSGIRVDVANKATALQYQRMGVPSWLIVDALIAYCDRVIEEVGA